VIWAPGVTEQCFGKTVKSYPHLGDRWILEEVVPWSLYGEWREEAFGPKPNSDGPYCHAHTIQFGIPGKETQYMSLEDFGAESLRLLIKCAVETKLVPHWLKKNHRLEIMEREEKDTVQVVDDAFDDASGIGLVGGPLGENAISGIPGKKTSADQKIILLEDLPPHLQAKLRCKPGSIKQIS
jgi:hypothetical protein